MYKFHVYHNEDLDIYRAECDVTILEVFGRDGYHVDGYEAEVDEVTWYMEQKQGIAVDCHVEPPFEIKDELLSLLQIEVDAFDWDAEVKLLKEEDAITRAGY